jgi:threonylcarbamoyladenosine tRNA methylthiotransferase MtaB
MKKTAAFLSLGCKVNSYETEAMRTMFETAGYEIVDFKEIADVYVVNTCTVTNIADRKSRQMLHQAKRRNPKAVIAAVGCYVQAAEEILLADQAVDLVVGNNKKSDIVAMVERCLGGNKKEELVVDIRDQKEYEELNVITMLERTRAFIKIQDGCDRFCSYCIIPYVRGRVRSRKEAEILEEIKGLVNKGYKEIVLTGIHISSYGTDVTDASINQAKAMSPEDRTDTIPLALLISKIGILDGVERIRLGSLEPGIITKEFLDAIVKVKQFCPHFHLSLQSGSDTVLKRMNRRYTTEEYYKRILLIRSYFELPAFTTDIIEGFPGETNEEFEETLSFVKKVGFSHIHVFKYSKRAGTRAADMPDQISEEIKTDRSNALIHLSEIISQEYMTAFLGRIEKVLFEEEITIEGRCYQVGHTERYLKMAVLCKDNLTNRIYKVAVCNKLTDEILLCKIYIEFFG